jgi:ubiquinone/menaquinone biosynthesis C-methylase UbiE
MSAPDSGQRAEDYSHLSARGQALVARFRDAVVARVATGGPDSVLEVGCGQGWLLARIAETLPDTALHGLDVRADAIEYAARLVPEASLTVGDGASLPYPDRSFAVVVCSQVIEHVEDPVRVLAEIRRVGKGHAVISVPHEPWFWAANLARGKYLPTLGNCPGHIHHYTSRSLARLLRTQFSSAEVSTSFPWLVADVVW